MLVNKEWCDNKAVITLFNLTTNTTIKYINYIFIIILTLTSILIIKKYFISKLPQQHYEFTGIKRKRPSRAFKTGR